MPPVVTSRDVPPSGELRIATGTIVTPAARELAQQRGVAIVEVDPHELSGLAPPERTVILGADHAGFRLKEALKPVVEDCGYVVRDVGVYDESPADYPEIAARVAELVAAGRAARGIIVDGAGTGSAIAANKVPGIRAAPCYDKASARSSREHNDANVLTLGGCCLTVSQAEEVLRTWLATPFAGGRHTARVQKIAELDERYRTWKSPNSSDS
ncbi:MAG: RpiB/LacA/LacB family sugar-phosphate isomerase [Bryobacterales bacterium]|nr:RpiB/LacA/LacB family sugar-phosphate isomerase [Bryobacteraceae bacterium]MDW8353317.1 RpiB/LacA/LacB family sugar-phosphate isomerase [Bryobacterales bacterium]